MPQSHYDDSDDDGDRDGDGEYSENDEGIMDEDMLVADLAPLKWPMKPGVSNSKVFTMEDSWYEPPPEGFSLHCFFILNSSSSLFFTSYPNKTKKTKKCVVTVLHLLQY